MPWQPLTQDQYDNASKAGFSPDQIMNFEVTRKHQQTGADSYAQSQANLAGEQAKNKLISGSLELAKDTVAGVGNPLLGRVLRPLWGGVQGAVSAKTGNLIQDIKQGMQNPDDQEPFGVSYARSEKLDLNKPLDFTLATVADVSANILTGHLLYGLPVKAAVGAYAAAKSGAFQSLRDTMSAEFFKAGASTQNADILSMKVADNLNKMGFAKNNPVAVKILENRLKGNLGRVIKNYLDAARAKATASGASPDFYPKVAKLHLTNVSKKLISSKVPGEPITDFGQQLKQAMLNRPPFTPKFYMGFPKKPVSSKVETTKTSRWGGFSAEPMATIPGEPIDYLDIKDEDPNTAKAALLETEDGKYYISLPGGKLLPNPNSPKGKPPSPLFNTADEAKKHAEIVISSSIQPSTQPNPTVASKPLTPKIPTAAVNPPSVKTTPTTPSLRPAIKIKEGQFVIAKPGEHHDDIISRHPELKNKQRGFVDEKGNFLNRTQAAAIVGQEKPLYSEDITPRLDKIKQIAQKHASLKTGTFMDKGTPEKVQQLSPHISKINNLYAVHIYTPQGEKIMSMNTNQLEDFKEGMKDNQSGIKIQKIEPIDSDDPKFKEYHDKIAAIEKMRKKCQG